MKHIVSLLILVISISGTSFGQTYTLKDFKEIKLPEINTKEWSELNYSQHAFQVPADYGEIRITKASKEKKATLEVEDGKLVGTDRGEWGGKIEFLSNGAKEGRLIKEGNVKSIFKLKEQVYFIEGLAHLSSSKETMFRLDKSEGNWIPIKVIDFEDAPEAMGILGNNIYVASHESFFVIRDIKKEKIFSDTFWSSLYPNSVAIIDENNIYLGLRGGFAKLDITKKKIRFFRFIEYKKE